MKDGPAVVAIRPEHLRLADANGPNVVAGRLGECVFRGEYWDCDVHTTLGKLRVRIEALLPAGADCRVAIPADLLFTIQE
jgi:TOBE domain